MIMSPVRSKGVNLSDIAEYVGVSRGAVAKVLNNTGGDRVRVSEATAQRIRQAARKLNYRPNLAARQLAGSKSKLIGAVIDTYANHNMSIALANIEKIVSGNGYRLVVGYTHDSYDRIKGHVEDFHSRGVDGVICMAYNYPEYELAIEELFTGFEHCVFLGGKPISTKASYLAIDHQNVSKIATEHLLQHGRKRIALMHPTLNPNVSGNTTIEGYRQACMEAQGQVDERLCHCMSELIVADLQTAKRCIERIIPLKPDGLIAGSDESAIWYLKALQEMGYTVPGDIAVVTLEHWGIGQGITPSLTSIDYQASSLANDATEMLFEMINNPKSSRPTGKLVEPKLIIGQSCGCQPL